MSAPPCTAGKAARTIDSPPCATGAHHEVLRRAALREPDPQCCAYAFSRVKRLRESRRCSRALPSSPHSPASPRDPCDLRASRTATGSLSIFTGADHLGEHLDLGAEIVAGRGASSP